MDDLKIKEILLEEHTMGGKLNINPYDVVPRYLKNQETQQNRTKEKAEVFTPIEVVKKMNDSFDIDFNGTDEEYIKRKVIEVTCGEAPFLTTRYDVSNGNNIELKDRVGLLDRKLQHIKTDDRKEWVRLATIALQNTYGFEWQEDSLFLARMNVLMCVVETYMSLFGEIPMEMDKWAEIVSWNIFRMDGVTMCLPETEIPVVVMNWEIGEPERYDGVVEMTLW